MLDAIMQDVRYAMRALRSGPGFAAVAILSLALGIGANTAIFSLIDSLLLKALPVSHPEQLLQVTMAKNAYFTNPIWGQLRDRQDVFSGIFAYGMAGGRFNLAAGGEARYAHGNVASGQFFDTLGLHAMVGRTVTNGRRSAGLSRNCRAQLRILAEGVRRPRRCGGQDHLARQSPLRHSGRDWAWIHGRRRRQR
jgi:hypothetical protein